MEKILYTQKYSDNVPGSRIYISYYANNGHIRDRYKDTAIPSTKIITAGNKVNMCRQSSQPTLSCYRPIV